MIADIFAKGADPTAEGELIGAINEHNRRVLASRRGRDQSVSLGDIEAEVSADPARCITFDERGTATLRARGREWAAGRFMTPSLASLCERAAGATSGGRARLFVLYGERVATDIGAMQAFAGPGTLFQVASQFNCLEATSARVVPIAGYTSDPTQGPRASVSAFPGTFVRHYRAPAPDGRRFTQTTGGEQINLLEDVCDDNLARVQSGYLRAADVRDPGAYARALEENFKFIRVGVHDDVEVALGFDWYGAVEGAPRVAQVFTSTLAVGYGGGDLSDAQVLAVCRQLLRGAYLGALLAARALGQHTAVLTLIGGGAFRNPTALIWESIVWAVDEVQRLAPGALDVVVNGRRIEREVPPEALVEAARARGGVVVDLSHDRVYVLR